MQYLDALQLIRRHYNTIQHTEDIEIIKINKLLDFSNYYFIVLLNDNGFAKLSDMGKTGDIIELPDTTWNKLAKQHNIDYRDYTLSTNFTDIKDLYNFITLLDKVSKED
jgi:hypothetical protein